MSRPRVFVLTVGFGLGGAEQLILTTAPRLRDAGFEVTVGALKGMGPIAGELHARGIRCVAFGGAGRRDLPVLARLFLFLRREPMDLIHAHLFRANVAARVIGRMAGVPVIVTAHHDTDVWMGRRHRLLERLTARLSDRIVTCSDAVGEYAVGKLGLPKALVCTLRNAIEIEPERGSAEERRQLRRAFGAADGDLLVGTLGRLQEPKKGLSHFLAAAARVAAEMPRARFVLVGDGPSRALLEQQAAACGIASRTHFAGPRRDVGAAMAAFDLFVQPSLWEGFGLTLLEAMAARRPIVASRVGGVPEVVRDDREGLLVPAGDPDACARAMITILSDPERARRYGEAGRARVVAEFGIDRLVDETVALYHGLLEGSEASGSAASGAASEAPADRRGRAA